jgi:hypothetical protein
MIISLHDHPIGASDKEMSKWVLGNITRIHDKYKAQNTNSIKYSA